MNEHPLLSSYKSSKAALVKKLFNTNEPTIDDALQQKSNNFDFIRFLAALTVLISHSYPLLGIGYEPFYAKLGGYDTGGGLAVAAFFVISGFLITQSSINNNFTYFFISRLTRIIPGLFGVLLFQVFIIGPLFTSLNFSEYFKQSLPHLSGAFVFNLQTHLPGTFNNLPVNATNGSLWTLPVEATFYVFSAILVFIGLTSKYTTLVLSLFSIAAFLTLQNLGFQWEKQGPAIVAGISAYNFTKLISFYLIGATIYHFRHLLKVSLPIFLASVLMLYLAKDGAIKSFVYFTAFPYCIIFLSLYIKSNLMRLGVLKKYPEDISYGVYLYAFPIQQSIVQITNQQLSPTQLTLIAAPITILLAFISYHTIEKKAVILKNQLLKKSQNIQN